MTAYRTASYYRVATYLRLHGSQRRLGFFFVRSINPIKEDLVDLQIVPTRDRGGFLIHFEDHDCSKLPRSLKYVDYITAKGICQFIVDNIDGSIYVHEDERPVWEDLFGKIDYGISFSRGRVRFHGLNGANLEYVNATQR